MNKATSSAQCLVYEPHMDHIFPKIVTVAAGNGAGQQMIAACWLDSE